MDVDIAINVSPVSLTGNVIADIRVTLHMATGTHTARIAHTAFALAGPFASLAVSTPAAPVLAVTTLSGRLTLTADIAVAVSAMDDSASVTVSNAFLLAGAASGVNATYSAMTLLHIDALSWAIAANRSLATLPFLTTAPSAASPSGRDRPFPIECLIAPFFQFVLLAISFIYFRIEDLHVSGGLTCFSSDFLSSK